MNYLVYCIYDEATLLYSAPYTAVNDADMVRRLRMSYTNMESIVQDLSVVRLGTYDPTIGEFSLIDNPEKERFTDLFSGSNVGAMNE